MNIQTAKDPAYRSINIVLISIVVMLFFLALALPHWRSAIGIPSRLIFAVLCFVNSAWLFRMRKSMIGGGLLLIIGIGLVATALIGYGFNGTPPLPWLFR